MVTFPNRDSRGSSRGHFRWLLIRCLGICALVFSSPCLRAEGPDIPFAEDLFPELRQLIDQASRESIELQLGELKIEEREGDLDVARGQRLPRAQLWARVLGSYETRDDIGDQTRGDLNGNLSVTQPFYQWGALKKREEIAEYRVTLEELQMEQTGSEKFMQLRRAYLQWVLMRERRDILAQSIELSESFVAARRQLLDAGLSSEQEVLEMEARLMENRESLAYIEKTIGDLENSFSQLTGRNMRELDLRGDSLEVIQPMSETEFNALQTEVRSRWSSLESPQSERWGMLETIEDEQLEILDKRNYPMFDFVTGIYSDRLDAVNNEDSIIRVQYFAGVQVNWNIFDGWQTTGYKRSALARKRTYNLLKEKTTDDLQQRVESLLSELQLNLKQIEARGKRETLIERRIQLLRQQVEQNLISGVELIEGEIDYLEVRRRLMEARVSYLMNLMELGVILEADPAVESYRDTL